MAKRILISGAGIAGCCRAWWLDRYDFEGTLVEQAAEPRRGGYVIDFWGLGYEVAQRMGLLDTLRLDDLDIGQFLVVYGHGRRVAGSNQGALKDLAGGRIMSLPRSAVASALYGSLGDRVPVRFGESISTMAESGEGVDVTFRSGASATYDLVVGADGLHSAVRRMAFGAEAQFERLLGYYVAAFTAPGYPHRNPHTYVTYGEPGRQIWRITMQDGTTVFLLVFAEANSGAIATHDPAEQKAILAERYAGIGWEGTQMLQALAAATDLYLDRVSQIVMPRWTNGRIALIGDACACPSLLAGEGSSMAMAEAYSLAGELDAAGGDHARAFQNYEQQLRPYVERKQKGARGFAGRFVPKTALGLWGRNVAIEAMTRLGLPRLAFGALLNDNFALRNNR